MFVEYIWALDFKGLGSYPDLSTEKITDLKKDN